MKFNLFLFKNFFIINLIYTALAGVLFPYKSPISVVIGGGFAILTIYWNLYYVKDLRQFSWIYFYSFYVLVLVLFSSDFFYSLKIFFKVFTAIWIFPVSYYLLRDEQIFKAVLKKNVPLVLLYLLNFVIMNAIGIGLKGYGDVINTGNLFTEGLNLVSYLIACTPLYLFYFRSESTRYLVLVAAILITQILTLKRISILGSFASIFIYLIFTREKSKYILGVTLVSILLVISYPFVETALEQQLSIREKQLSAENLEEEARFKEYQAVNEKIFSFEDISVSLFGEEVFNSQGVYGDYSIFGERQIHNDYSRLLHDTGILGILFFFLVQIKIYSLYKRHFRIVSFVSTTYHNTLRAVFMSIYLMGFIFMFSGGIDGTLFQSFRYMLLGGIIGILEARRT